MSDPLDKDRTQFLAALTCPFIFSAGGMEGSSMSSPDPSSVLITQITLANTLLSDAVESLRARFISDCAKYLQVRMCGSTISRPTAM